MLRLGCIPDGQCSDASSPETLISNPGFENVDKEQIREFVDVSLPKGEVIPKGQISQSSLLPVAQKTLLYMKHEIWAN